jgi:hypothetical protein
MMEAEISFETSASIMQSTRYLNPGENNMNPYQSQHFKPSSLRSVKAIILRIAFSLVGEIQYDFHVSE